MSCLLFFTIFRFRFFENIIEIEIVFISCFSLSRCRSYLCRCLPLRLADAVRLSSKVFPSICKTTYRNNRYQVVSSERDESLISSEQVEPSHHGAARRNIKCGAFFFTATLQSDWFGSICWHIKKMKNIAEIKLNWRNAMPFFSIIEKFTAEQC